MRLIVPGPRQRLRDAMYRLPPGPRTMLRLWARAWQLPFVGRGGILLYHRVTELAHDPWALAVPPSVFASHLAVLAERTTCLPLAEFLRRRELGTLPKNATALTFDDGYADNLREALPLLERHGIPATVFVMTGFVDGDRETWWDRLEQAVFETPALPRTVELEVDGRPLIWRRPEGAADGAARHDLHLTLHDAVGTVDAAPREAAIAALWRQLGRAPRLRPSHRPLTLAELHSLAAHPLITIGAHTRNHPQLPRLTATRQREELASSKATLEDWLAQPIDLVAYPHGAHDERTCAVAAELGFRAGFTTRPRVVPHRAAPHRLPRLNIETQDARSFTALLRFYGVAG